MSHTMGQMEIVVQGEGSNNWHGKDWSIEMRWKRQKLLSAPRDVLPDALGQALRHQLTVCMVTCRL